MSSLETTLVLGAGASFSMGYPVGAGLRQQLLQLADGNRQTSSINAGLYDPPGMLQKFVREFRESQLDSIDNFLARRTEFADIGKRAIAAVLLACENRDQLFSDESDDHWYRYLFNKLAADSWDELNFSKLSIVTFNYDRSFEHYLLWALMSSYGRSQEDVIDKLRQLQVIHIYGTLGAIWPNHTAYMPYGSDVTREKVTAAANTLRIIPEGRADDTTLQAAKALLYNADTIIFLGFGFDQTNLDRLNASKTCRAQRERLPNNFIERTVVATCKGLTVREIRSAHRRVCGDDPNSIIAPRYKSDFLDTDCLGLLRATLALD